MRETQERYPSPLKSIVFETFLRFQKTGQRGKNTLFWHAEYRGICLGFFIWGRVEYVGGGLRSQCAHWLRDDRALQEVRCAGRCGHRPLRILCNTNFCNKKGMPVRASLLSFYAGAIALARVCAYSISRRFDCLASWVTLGRISSRTPLSYLALMLAVSMPATLKLRL